MGRTVLVVDDEHVVLSVCSSMLGRFGYTVLEAHDANEALHLLERWKDVPVDVALVDINLPLMSGLELAEQIKQLRPNLPVVYISAYPDNADLRPAYTRDLPFVSKPFTSAKLLYAVDKAILESKVTQKNLESARLRPDTSETEDTRAMQAALRVLTALTQRHDPSPADVQALESYAGPKPPDVDMDLFACSVIQEGLKRRAKSLSSEQG